MRIYIMVRIGVNTVRTYKIKYVITNTILISFYSHFLSYLDHPGESKRNKDVCTLQKVYELNTRLVVKAVAQTVIIRQAGISLLIYAP